MSPTPNSRKMFRNTLTHRARESLCFTNDAVSGCTRTKTKSLQYVPPAQETWRRMLSPVSNSTHNTQICLSNESEDQQLRANYTTNARTYTPRT
eukprot:3550612-Amphidinium_carterae.1